MATKKHTKLTPEEIVLKKELEEKLLKMKEDREKKCKSAKEQLVDMIEVTADKYRTVTGTAEALRVIRFVCEDADKYDRLDIYDANRLAHTMADVCEKMAARAKDLEYGEMDKLCDGFYDKTFVLEYDGSNLKGKDRRFKMATQMLCIDLCRNVGGAGEDIVGFIKRSDEEIEATEAELQKLLDKEK